MKGFERLFQPNVLTMLLPTYLHAQLNLLKSRIGLIGHKRYLKATRDDSRLVDN